MGNVGLFCGRAGSCLMGGREVSAEDVVSIGVGAQATDGASIFFLGPGGEEEVHPQPLCHLSGLGSPDPQCVMPPEKEGLRWARVNPTVDGVGCPESRLEGDIPPSQECSPLHVRGRCRWMQLQS